MAHESQDADDKMWPPHIEQIFIEIMLDEQVKGNMKNGVLKMPVWESITRQLNTQTGKNFLTKKVIQKHNRLRQKQGKWGQLLNHTGLGWDEITQFVTSSEKVWANVVVVRSLPHLCLYIYYFFCQFYFVWPVVWWKFYFFLGRSKGTVTTEEGLPPL